MTECGRIFCRGGKGDKNRDGSVAQPGLNGKQPAKKMPDLGYKLNQQNFSSTFHLANELK